MTDWILIGQCGRGCLSPLRRRLSHHVGSCWDHSIDPPPSQPLAVLHTKAAEGRLAALLACFWFLRVLLAVVVRRGRGSESCPRPRQRFGRQPEQQ